MFSRFSLLLILLTSISCSDSTSAKPSDGKDSSFDTVSDVGQNNDASSDTSKRDQGTQSDVQIVNDLGSSDTGSDAVTRPDFGDKVFGGDRPARVFLPDDYDVNKSYPLVTLLHGYSAGGQTQNRYLRIGAHVTELQFILILPEGLRDNLNNKYWNATAGCCDFDGTNPDDSGYLMGLVDEAILRYNIDEKRISFMGHSNGGFMSYTMACEYGDRIAAIASLAGTTHLDPVACPDTGDVSILHIHGTLDAVINIRGADRNGTLEGYPGATETLNRWATRNGCPNEAVDGERINIVGSLIGDETRVQTWSGCNNDTEVEYWRIVGGSHTPLVNDGFADGVLEFLLSHSK